MTVTDAPAPVAPAGGAARPVDGRARSGRDAGRTLYALLASALGILPLNALFKDSAWLLDVWVAMLIVIAPAAIMRIWRQASAIQIWAGVVLLVPYLTLRFVHQHAIAGFIPGPGTWHDVHVLFIRLHDTTAHGVAPVHTTNAIKLVLCALLPLIAALIDLLAVVGRRGALAGVPLLIAYTISGAVPRHPVSWPLFVFAAIAFLVLLSLDSRDDLQRWGHFVARSGWAGRRAAGAISAQRIATVAVILAVVVPAFVQANTHNLLSNVFHNGSKSGQGGDGLGSGGTAGIDPFASLKGELTRSSPVNLLTVQVQRVDNGTGTGTGTVQPFYARENVLSTYTGTAWTVGQRGPLEDLSDTTLESEPGTPHAPETVEFHAAVTVDKLTSDPPVFVQPDQLGNLTDATRWSPQDQLLIGGTTHPGEKYQVNFAQPNPTKDELDGSDTVDASLQPWLTLPTIAPSVHQLVDTITASAVTPYEKALAIENYFTNPSSGFVYNLTVPPGKTGDPLVDFLTNKIGFCQQYAAAMGVMLRLAGVPSRVVLGYTHPVPDKNGKFTITTNDAHAWDEAYFSGIGWIPFDPTPLNGIDGGSSNDLPWAPHLTAALPSSGSSGVVLPKISKPHTEVRDTGSTSATADARTNQGVSLTGPIVGGALLLVLLGLASPGVQRTRRRRGRIRAGRAGDADALWSELTDTAIDLGFDWSQTRSPRQVVDWLGRSVGDAKPALALLADAVEQTRYAPPGSVHVAGDALVDEFTQVQHGLIAGRARTVQLHARLLPASLGWTTNLPARLADRLRLPSAWRNRRH